MSSVASVTPAAAPKRSSLRRWLEVAKHVVGLTVLLVALIVTAMATFYYTQECLSSPHPTSNGKTACAVYQGQVVCATFGTSRVTIESLPNKNTYIVLAVLFGLMAAMSLAGLIKLLNSIEVFRRRRKATA